MWIGTSRAECSIRTYGAMPIHASQMHLTHLSNVKSIIFCALELVHKLGGFSVIESDDGIGQVSVKASE